MPDVDTSREAVERLRKLVAMHANAVTIATLRALLEEREEQDRLIDAIWNANMTAINAWRKSNPGNDLVLPDQKVLVTWLLEERDTCITLNNLLRRRIAYMKEDEDILREERDRLREALEEVKPLVMGANHFQARYPKARAALGEGGKDE